MSRTPSELVARLELLEAARKEIGRKKLVLNAQEMATAAGMSWVALRNYWIKKFADFPILKRGSEGVAWEFDAAKVIDFMIGKARSAKVENERRRAQVKRFSGLEAAAVGETSHSDSGGGTAIESGAAAEAMLKQARAYDAILDLRARLRNDRISEGSLIDRAAAQKFLWGWLSTLQGEVLSLGRRLDKANRFEPELRDALDEELAALLVRMRDRLRKFIGEPDVLEAGSDRGRAGEDRQRRVSRPDRGRRRAGAGAAHSA